MQFKADATVLRKHALAARGDAAAVRGMLDGRAATLAARVGRTLEAGPAVGERMQVLRARGLGAAVLAAQLAADPEVEFAVPNGRQRIVNVPLPPNDPFYLSGPPVDPSALTGGPASGQWYLRAPTAAAVGAPGDIVSAIDIESAWARTLGRPDVVVAVLDTGVRFEHPDLRRTSSGGSLLPGYDFVSDATIANDGNGRDGDPSDPGDWVSLAEAGRGSFTGCEESHSSWHGTRTASLVGAATGNNLGMAGSAPACACSRFACSASATAPTPTSRPACCGPPVCPLATPACRPTRTRRASSTSAWVATAAAARPTSRWWTA